METKIIPRHTRSELSDMQKYPLDTKIFLTKTRIRGWIIRNGVDGVYVSFSGGKDSTVLLDIARKMYPNIPAVFSDTGMEYPEIRDFVKGYDNVEWLKPTHYGKPITFGWVVAQYGYPIIGKEVAQAVHRAYLGQRDAIKKLNGQRIQENGNASAYNMERWKPLVDVPFKISDMCCNKMKKGPFEKHERKNNMTAITAEMAQESRLRTTQWLAHGCNGFDMSRPKSTPMAFWTEQDVLQYIQRERLPIASVYGDIEYADEPDQMRLADYTGKSEVPDSEKLRCTGCQRTGCIFCAFGAHLEKGEGRFQRLKRTHPKLYEHCMGGGEWQGKMWQPSKAGLGMAYVFDTLNGIYGKDFLPY